MPNKKPSLAETHPELCKEWDYERNELSPEDVTYGSGKKVWWTCSKSKDHDWDSRIKNRVLGVGCPYCSNKKVLAGYNDLASTNPSLASQWHPTLNKLNPTEVTKSSGKKVWWHCLEGHYYESTVANRNNGNNCPYCSNKKILQGYNDLSTTDPILAQQWHPTKNKLSPTEITAGSAKKMWWVCDEGHEWEAVVCSRVAGCGCPICSNKKVLVGYNDLQTTHPDLCKEWNSSNKIKTTEVTFGSQNKVWWICSLGHEWVAVIHSRRYSGCPYCSNRKILIGFNDLQSQNTELAKEWSSKNKLKPTEVTMGSNKKVWWVCELGHEWEAVISSRIVGCGCPYCSPYGGKILEGFNDLFITNPELSKKWHPTKNHINPSEVSRGSHKYIWWLGECGHEWEAPASSTIKGHLCPYCARKKVLTGFNDLHSQNPELSKQWHPSNNSTNPSTIINGSHKKVWWVCDEGHEWEASVKNRSNGRGCPSCRDNLGSEVLMVSHLEQHFGSHLGQKLDFKFGSRNWCRVDYVNESRLIVEYDGEYWHMNVQDRDTRKTELLLSEGYTVVRLRQGKLPHLNIQHPNFAQFSVKWDKEGKDLRRVIEEELVPWWENKQKEE